MPGLVFNYVDPSTGFAYPDAFLAINDVRVHLISGLAVLDVAIYATQALHDAGKDPLWSDDNFFMTGAEIETEQPKFLSDLYNLLAARQQQFPGATVVT